MNLLDHYLSLCHEVLSLLNEPLVEVFELRMDHAHVLLTIRGVSEGGL